MELAVFHDEAFKKLRKSDLFTKYLCSEWSSFNHIAETLTNLGQQAPSISACVLIWFISHLQLQNTIKHLNFKISQKFENSSLYPHI